MPRPFPHPRATVERPADRADRPLTTEPSHHNHRVDGLLSTALQFVGTPYRNGGADAAGFDCSGFTQYVFAQHGMTLPREVRDQFALGTPVGRDDIAPGDLVFFSTVSKGASHVAIVIGPDDFVHAPSSRGVVRVEHLTSAYWSTRLVGIRRLTVR
ncbi:MAG: C40 family peptidase [Vicinamibacterales bacterium]